MSQASVLKSYEWGDSEWNIDEIVDSWAVRQIIDPSKLDDETIAMLDAGLKSQSELPAECFKRLVLAVSSIPGYDTDGIPTAEHASVIRVDVEYLAPLVDPETGENLKKQVLSCDVYLN